MLCWVEKWRHSPDQLDSFFHQQWIIAIAECQPMGKMTKNEIHAPVLKEVRWLQEQGD
jgi:hypothetical protein